MREKETGTARQNPMAVPVCVRDQNSWPTGQELELKVDVGDLPRRYFFQSGLKLRVFEVSASDLRNPWCGGG